MYVHCFASKASGREIISVANKSIKYFDLVGKSDVLSRLLFQPLSRNVESKSSLDRNFVTVSYLRIDIRAVKF